MRLDPRLVLGSRFPTAISLRDYHIENANPIELDTSGYPSELDLCKGLPLGRRL